MRVWQPLPRLLDRGWGKALQAHGGDDVYGNIQVVIRQLVDVVGKEEPVLIEHDDGCDKARVICPNMPPRKVWTVTEEEELEATIKTLVDRLNEPARTAPSTGWSFASWSARSKAASLVV